jgi:exopolyphosphatase/guanosine-5'-triphosphate,3'-diphosphate pyrophosphatase
MLLNREIDTVLNNFGPDTGRLDPGATLFIGTGGTFTTVASVDLGLDSYSRQKIHLHRIPLSRLKQMQKTFLQLSLTERKKIRGLEPGRADLIIPGVQFTMKVMELFRFRELIVSDYGLLEGALLEMKEASEKGIPEAGKS